MCGIAGKINYREGLPPSTDILGRMLERITHRGPDQSSIYHSDNNQLGQVRLSIIDLTGGNQPVYNQDRSIVVVFNGEIFNYIELKNDYLSDYAFYTASDTEVIVALYEKFGIEFIDYLNGQFSIALYDANIQKTFLIRDRVGICPLYYAAKNDTIYFASEVKSLLQAPEIKAEINLAGFSEFIHLWTALSPDTLYRDIFEVQPGCYLQISERGIEKRRYWDFEYDPGSLDLSLDDAVFRLDEILTDAVSIRLRADVPVGAYLSGGLDSSIILSYLVARKQDLSTFSLTFADENLSEEHYQREVSDYFSTHHYTVQAGNNMIADHFRECIHYTESPLFRTSPVPMMLLSAKAREAGYKVVLTGEGSDEVFGGYDIFKEARIREFWSRFPDSSTRPALLKRIYPYLDLSKIRSVEYLKRAFGHNLEQTDTLLYAFNTRASTTSGVYDLLVDDVRAEINRDMERRAREKLNIAPQQYNVFNTAQYVESRTIMPGYILSSQGDRMLMANSIEGRFPFLDHRVIEFAGKLKNRYKMNGLNEKYILKRMAAGRIPESVLNRPKLPYRAPDIDALLCSRDDHLMEYMSPTQIKNNGFFDHRRVNLLVKKARAGRAKSVRDNILFTIILSTQIWLEEFIN